MDIRGNTVLITGGATGIGFALAEEFVKAGNEVIICGRRQEKLDEAKEKLPQLHAKAFDVSKAEQRKALFDWVESSFPETNVLLNNAGIQRMIDFKKGTTELFAVDDEIDINFKAYVHMAAYFIPPFMEKERAAIINVSSGLGFAPIAVMPVYCATKAAIHSFTTSLRHQLRNTPIRVFEVIPPTVNTDLDKGARKRRGQTDFGIPPAEVARAVMESLEGDEFEIPVGQAKNLKMGARSNPDELFQRMNH